jgi:hypothetical protein
LATALGVACHVALGDGLAAAFGRLARLADDSLPTVHFVIFTNLNTQIVTSKYKIFCFNK